MRQLVSMPSDSAIARAADCKQIAPGCRVACLWTGYWGTVSSGTGFHHFRSGCIDVVCQGEQLAWAAHIVHIVYQFQPDLITY